MKAFASIYVNSNTVYTRCY